MASLDFTVDSLAYKTMFRIRISLSLSIRSPGVSLLARASLLTGCAMLQQQLNPLQEDVTETGTVWVDLHEVALQCYKK